MTPQRHAFTTRRCATIGSALLLATLSVGCATEPQTLDEVLSTSPLVAAVATMELTSSREGWRSTGVEVAEGQAVTLLAEGDGVGARVWVRIGGADIENLGGPSYSFSAWASGEVEVISMPPGVRWERCDGRLPPGFDAAEEASPAHRITAIAWTGEAATSLRDLAQQHPRELTAELTSALTDLENTRPLPAGFRSICYLPRSTTVFEAWDEGDQKGIWGNASSNAGIVKKAVDLPLDEATEISFDWRYDALHSLGPETDAAHHDYSSIALEFENGQDITWMRSPHLEAVTAFGCPLEWWDGRETHIVLQGGRADVGVWQSHTRNVLADYEMAVGGELPQRIVGVWFISVGVFAQTTADTKYKAVVLRSGSGEELQVFD